MPDIDAVARFRYVSFTTFRRTGEAVSTPVWIARDGGELVFISDDNVGKVKRLRNNSAVELRECTVRGAVATDSPVYKGTATVHRDPASIAEVRRAVGRKYVLGRVGNVLRGALRAVGRARPTVAIRIVLG